jgi:hypothetical protein
MTLQQLFDWIQMQPMVVVYYYLVILALTVLASQFAKEEAHLAPWNMFYAVIIYLVCIPGIFAVTLSIYFFLFEKRSIMDTELILQVLPVFMMIVILLLIRKTIDFDLIPGFDKISNLILIIAVLLSLMWIIDRTHLYAISFVPFYLVFIIIIGGIFAMRMAFKKMIRF